MHWIYLIHKFHNLSWITEINKLFHATLIYWDAPIVMNPKRPMSYSHRKSVDYFPLDISTVLESYSVWEEPKKKKNYFIKALLSLVAQYEKEVEVDRESECGLFHFAGLQPPYVKHAFVRPQAIKKASLQPSFHCPSAFNNSKICEKKLIEGSYEIWLIIFFFSTKELTLHFIKNYLFFLLSCMKWVNERWSYKAIN